MRLLEIQQLAPKYLYHVTFSEHVPSIKEKGLMQFQPSNWVKGEGGTRYNEEAGIFAFEDPEDAFKWAFNMQWQHKNPISIVRIKPGDIWEQDPSEDDNLRMGKGRAMMSRRNIPAENIIDAFDMKDFGTPAELGIPQSEWFAKINSMLTESANTLPPNVVKAFLAVADAQRGEPEMAMLRVQRTMGGGVLSPVVEHIGDLTHRMTEHADAGYWLEDIIQEKVKRGLMYLTHGYGFEKEMQENIRANKTNVEELDKRLLAYAKAHEQIPVYNAAQYHGREAAVALGYKDWGKSIEHLRVLQNMLDKGVYERVAASYLLSGDKLQAYSP